MFRRMVLPTLLIVGLFITAGVALAAVDDGATATSMSLPGGDDTSTSTSLPEDGDDDSSTSTSLPGGDDTSTSTSTSLPDPVIEDGIHVIDASPAGSITVEVVDGRLRLVATDLGAAWDEVERRVSGNEIELKYRDHDTELEIEVEIEDGALKVHVEFEHRSAGGSDDDR